MVHIWNPIKVTPKKELLRGLWVVYRFEGSGLIRFIGFRVQGFFAVQGGGVVV